MESNDNSHEKDFYVDIPNQEPNNILESEDLGWSLPLDQYLATASLDSNFSFDFSQISIPSLSDQQQSQQHVDLHIQDQVRQQLLLELGSREQIQQQRQQQPAQRAFSLTSHPGICGFNVTIENPPTISKTSQWAYSGVLPKLYVLTGKTCPLQIHVKDIASVGSYQNLQVRAQLYLTHPECYNEPIYRCSDHLTKDSATMTPFYKHTLRCEELCSEYEEDETGRHAVVTRLMDPAPGDSHLTLRYRFMCATSCPGITTTTSCTLSLERRAMAVMFVLEDLWGEALGRYCLPVKVCSSPGRDMKREEKKAHKKLETSSTIPVPEELSNCRKAKKQKTSHHSSTSTSQTHNRTLSNVNLPMDDDDVIYNLEIRGKVLFEYMKNHLQHVQQLVELQGKKIQGQAHPAIKEEPK